MEELIEKYRERFSGSIVVSWSNEECLCDKPTCTCTEDIITFLRTQFPLYAAKEIEAARDKGFIDAGGEILKDAKERQKDIEKAKAEGAQAERERLVKAMESMFFNDAKLISGLKQGEKDQWIIPKEKWNQILLLLQSPQ